MLEKYVKRCRKHGSCSAVRSILELERGVAERFAADKDDWAKVPQAATEHARECVTLKTLDGIVCSVHVRSKLNGEICAGVYMIADLYNELTTARKALSEANAMLILNHISPIEESDAYNNTDQA